MSTLENKRVSSFLSIEVLLALVLILASSLVAFNYTQHSTSYNTTASLPDVNAAVHILSSGEIIIPESNMTQVPIVRQGDTYSLLANVPRELIIQKSNIIVNGQGFSIGEPNAADNYQRIDLLGVSNVTIRDVNTQPYYYSIRFDQASNNTVVNCTVSNILFLNSQYNTILNCSGGKVSFVSSSNNTISNCFASEFQFQESNSNRILYNNSTMAVGNDLYLVNSSNNLFFGNSFGSCLRWISMVGNSTGNFIEANNVNPGSMEIQCSLTGNNTFYHNDFINLSWNASITTDGSNTWSINGQGNYWSNYLYFSFYLNNNGTGSIPYVVDETNVDNHPLLAPIVIAQQKAPSTY